MLHYCLVLGHSSLTGEIKRVPNKSSYIYIGDCGDFTAVQYISPMVNCFFNGNPPFPSTWNLFRNSFSDVNIKYKFRNSGRYADQCSSLLLDFFYKDGVLSDKNDFDKVQIHKSGLYLRDKISGDGIYDNFNLYEKYVTVNNKLIRTSDIDIIYKDSIHPTPAKIKKDIFNNDETLDYMIFRNRFKELYRICLSKLFDKQHIFIMAGCRCVRESCIRRTKTNSDELKDDEIFGWKGDARGNNKYIIKTKKKKKKNNPSKRKRNMH